jgi:hypothetical protein
MKHTQRQHMKIGVWNLVRHGLVFWMSLMISSAFAWGTHGHQVIARIAEAQLTTSARAEVARLLALEPGETIQSVSMWADENRSPGTGHWHYVNFPRGTCKYNAERDCPGGKCVVGIIEREMRILESGAPDEVRLKALKNLVHFVGDVHQPLHAGYLDDKGGNKFQLQVFMRSSNLHALWDSGLIKNLNEDTNALTVRLLASGRPSMSYDLNASTAAEESCKIVGMPGFYPERKVNTEYIKEFTPVLEQRLLIAGARLAGLLNQAFK